MPSDLPTAVAQILGPDGSVAGAGFLVAEDVLVTCAHVVRAAGSGPGERVRLAFPRAAGADGLEGHVEGWRAPEGEDVAFVRLSEVPPGTRVLPLGSGAGCGGHEVRSYGFPAQAPRDGHLGFGTVGDLLPASQDGSALLQLTDANDLTTGFSGGPVLDQVTGLVVGMVTEITAPDPLARGQDIAYVTPTEVLREVRPELAAQEVCPYRGLEPFTAEHARWFEGRGDAVRQVVANLALGRRLTLLLGPSGSGKSSLIQAGVLRALAEGAVPGSDRWLPVLARPRQDLRTEIERAGLPGAAGDGITAAVDHKLASEPDHERVLLVIDQFEELLVQGADGRLQDFLAVVDDVTAAADAPTRLSVILVMRDDFYPQLAALAPKLLEAATPGLLNVPGALSQRDLHDIIVLPAEKAGLRFQPGLPEQIISDVLESSPEAMAARLAPVTVLPLLELTLKQLWSRREDGYLTHEAYRRIGAVTGSLTTWCGSALDELSTGQQQIARRILTSLVHPADPGRRIPAVRAQVPLDELRDLAAGPDGSPVGDVNVVIATLTHHRIITTQSLRDPHRPDAPPGEPVAELIHDALIRDWGKLREWVHEDRRFQEWLNRTRERQLRWAGKKDPGDLLAGTALGEGVDWSRERGLPDDIAAFLSASRQRQEAIAQRRRRLVTVLATLLVLALIAGGVAVWQWRTAVGERQAALSRQLAAQSDTLIRTNPELASLLAIQAYRTNPTSEALDSLRTAADLPLQRRLSGHAMTVTSVAFSPDSRTLATGSYDRTVRLWDVATGTTRHILKRHTDQVYSVAFSPDGRTLATAGIDGRVLLWDVATGDPLYSLTYSQSANAVAFSPDGKTLATATADTVQLWDATTRKAGRVLSGHTGLVSSVAFSPDSRTLATASWDRTTRLWDVATGTTRHILEGHTSEVVSVAYSPDGKTLATAGNDVTVLLWDVATGKSRTSLTTATDSVAFSPDGKSLATASPDHTVQLWNVTTGATISSLTGHSDQVLQTAFSPDGKTLASVGLDHTVRLWKVSTAVMGVTLAGHTDSVTSVAFSPDGNILATGSVDRTARLWNVPTGRARAPLRGHTGVIISVAFTPDGKTLATGSSDATARLWDVATGTTRRILKGHIDGVNSVAFSPDGKTLATVGSDQTVRLWDVATGTTRHILKGHTDEVTSVAYSPDGKTLATGSFDYTARLWDVSAGTTRHILRGHSSVIKSVAFSPDGKTLATTSNDQTARLWNVATGKTRTTLTGHTREVFSVAFSPDGKTLATGSSDNTTRLWDSSSGKERITLTRQTDPVIAVAFSPRGHTLATGSTDFTARLWHVDLPDPSEAVQKICRAVNRDLTSEERTAYLPGQSSGPVCPTHR
ncbi:trypsin-like peptidase domain-containing protein [Streptomyces sp. Ag109_G2-15]|uniref:nSTAND1 domain-containing NTPase n=1 Tax=Streptomyces sp. Ag109_G2-15 TaxID=1938850 RepID=UPI000BD4A7A1|nr:trypsin-like peptidase domain-containing protein [Streptomyces sp. Ag109_G2-15]SOD86419.1 ribosome assembly protein 4 (RSA4) [Streptomyces sp. Ag109_G2-15]